MEIKLPCNLGETIITAKGAQILQGASWFKWSDGLEYTYFFEAKDRWSQGIFMNETDPPYKTYYTIDDNFLQDDFLKSRKYPVKEKGYVVGIRLIDKQLYTEVILTDKYLAHIYIECDKSGKYVENGKVYVPPSWDADEKKYSIILHQYKNIDVKNLSF